MRYCSSLLTNAFIIRALLLVGWLCGGPLEVHLLNIAAAQQEAGAQNDSTVRAAVFDIQSKKTEVLGSEGDWAEIPEFVKGGKIHLDGLETTGNEHEYEAAVKNGGIVVLAVPWRPAITPGYDLYEMRKARREVAAEGKWTPIGTMYQGEGDRRKGFQIYRANAAAGDKVRFKSPGYFAPHVIEIGDEQATLIAATNTVLGPIFEMNKRPPPPSMPRGALSTQAAAELVQFNSVRADWYNTDATSWPITAVPILQRELFRQAVLLAVRDELGLSTRDGSLREPLVQQQPADVLPFEIAIERSVAAMYNVAILRQRGDQWETLWESELEPNAPRFPEVMVRVCEELSRTRVPAALESAGVRRRSRRPLSEARVPDSAAVQLNEFNFVAQFGAVRRLHAEIEARGESLELLAALSRGYAHLGSLTDFLWSTAHKVFTARGLLYAERLVVNSNSNAPSLWNRAYVRALAGRHNEALSDFERAEKIAQNEPDAARPLWAEVIRAHCQFDRPLLDALDADEKLRPLVRYLILLQQEYALRNKARMAAVVAVLEASPDCFRAMDLLSGVYNLGVQRAATDQTARLFPRSLCRRLPEIVGLPDEAAKLCQTGFAEEEGRDRTGDIQLQTALADLLSAAAPTDRGEPSLGVLAALIREAGFVHAWRLVNFQKNMLSASADSIIEELRPLVEKHPYRSFLDAFSSDESAVLLLKRQLASEVNSAEFEFTEETMVRWLGAVGRDNPSLDHWREAWDRRDAIYRDVAQALYRTTAAYNPAFERARMHEVSPHAPVLVTSRLIGDFRKTTLDQAIDWEKKHAADTTVLAALADFYLFHERYDAAERCMKGEIKLAPEWESYRRLAEFYKKRGDIDRWRATLEESLALESFGLEHAQARNQLALYHIERNEWEQALPWATQAAQTGAGWALLTASRCHEGLKDWATAEQYIRRLAQRYTEDRMEWYYWCRRTGRGDLDSARRDIEAYYDSLSVPFPLAAAGHRAVFLLLEGDTQAALDAFVEYFNRTKDPAAGLQAALLAHELGKPVLRDSMLEASEIQGAQARISNRIRTELVELAGLFRVHLRGGKNAVFDAESYEKLVKAAPDGEPTTMHYFAGVFLAQHGDLENSRKYLLLAATSPVIHRANRVLAAARLLSEKVELPETRAKE
jgi:tetratricopeptide (TPR) repeat protein